MEYVAIALVALAGGIAIGFVARSLWASTSVKAAHDKADRIITDARAQQKDLILEAKEEKIRLQREAEEE
ncbi:MAG: Rnase Y domain-containing protein, partial [Chloroflexota bacterium]